MLSEVNLSNWRTAPHNQWAFHNVRQIIPTSNITAGHGVDGLPKGEQLNPDSLILSGWNNSSLARFLLESYADSMVILHRGKKVLEWHADHVNSTCPHIIFSVSKSVTSMLAGVLVEQGQLDVSKPIEYYLSGAKGSGYENASLQQLLDMSVALDFEESYLDKSGDYRRYRDSTGWNPVDQANPGPDLETFLYSLKKSGLSHGEQFDYKSPNSDLLGLLIERVAAVPYADLLGSAIWQPMGAETDGYVTVDRKFLARGAGGICVTANDLARFGQLVLNRGEANGRQIIPESWIEDIRRNGDRDAWRKGDFVNLLPDGCYRNKWYQVRDKDEAFFALGIHGQWLYINPRTEMVIVKLSSQPGPLDDRLDMANLEVTGELCRYFHH